MKMTVTFQDHDEYDEALKQLATMLDHELEHDCPEYAKPLALVLAALLNGEIIEA